MSTPNTSDAHADGPTSPTHRVVVVGAGISGLSAAWRLLSPSASTSPDAPETDTGARGPGPVEVTVLDAADRVGGKLATGEVAGVSVDLGAEAMIARRPEGVDLAHSVGLGDALEPPTRAGSVVFSRGRPRALPKGHMMGVPGDLAALAESDLISPAGQRRVALEPRLPDPPVGADISVGEYVSARFGREVVDRLVEPLLGGVYAGVADRISLRAAIPRLFPIAQAGGSLLDGVHRLQQETAAAQRGPGPAPAVFTGIRGGLGSLPPVVAEQCRQAGADIRLGSRTTGLSRTSTGWRVHVEGPDGAASLDADAVLLAVPAPVAAELLDAPHPHAAVELSAVEYADMALVTMALRRSELDSALTGSGFLVPPVEGRTIKASTFSSNKWGWVEASDPDLFLLRTSVGRHGEERDVRRADEDLVELSRQDLRDAVGLTAQPVDTRVTRWHAGLPQYPVGHLERVERIRRHLQTGTTVPGVRLCGAAYDGVGVPACVHSGQTAAEQVLHQLAGHPGITEQ